MPRVKNVIEHILHHVNAEASTTNRSQVVGVADRAQLVREAVQTLTTDNRDITINDILLEISNKTPNRSGRTSFHRTITNIRDKNIPRPRLAIQSWVGKNREF